LDFQARVEAAVAHKQKEMASKRFAKKRTAEGDEQTSAYLKQKNELEKMSGSTRDEASKWLVR
jgi:hypothetical protein